MKKRILPHPRSVSALATFVLAASLASAQDDPLTAPENGPRKLDPGWHRIVGATIHTGPAQVIENGAIVVRDGRIVWVGPTPANAADWAALGGAGAREWDGTGLSVYAGLIDANVEVAVPAPDPDEPGTHWNSMVTPQVSALDGPGLDEKSAASLRELGFTAAVIAPSDGVFRGSAALVSLAAEPESEALSRPPVYSTDVWQYVAFDRARRGQGGGGYPSSLMGSIALIRQVLYDVEYRVARKAQDPSSLDALASETRLLFKADDELDVLRAAKIAREFDRPALFLGSGVEFKRLDAVRACGLANAILPIDFPEAPEVASVGAAESVSLQELMTWEQAPTNPRRVDEAGITVALTTTGLRKKSDFPANVRKAIEHGLREDRALAMVTTLPARMLGVEDHMGRLAPGMLANFVVTDGPLFAKGTEVRDVWIDGRRHEIKAGPAASIEGTWDVTLVPPIADAIHMAIGKKNAVELETAGEKVKARKVTYADSRISFVFDHDKFGDPGVFTLSALVEGDAMTGRGIRSNGELFAWKAVRTEAAKHEDKKEKDDDEASTEPVAIEAAAETESSELPFGPLGYDAVPTQPHWVEVRDATIWTSGPAGILEHATLVVQDGKITHVGGPIERERPAGAVVIDAKGKHVTPGLIDCHSHTGISRGVNEGGQAVTAEVRIGDVTDPDSINWYRELAGGLTAANCLHGSANPMGGQNQVVKLRWGCEHPDDMHFEGAIPGIKFALGENVTRANSRERSTRYPQSRMGVETLMRDRFNAARDYAVEWDAWKRSGRRGPAPRKDLELEALAEILRGQRLVHCHSYRQDEILMLCRLAGEYGFKLGTFQHILEGYKVAEAVRENALGASCFSDWWGYKVEVQDAIPYAGAIMHDAGVVVSFNSDSDELARRMNLEAAKAVKYGDIEPAEALKFVTLNPAKQLKVDDRVGSLEVGKDGDFVVWSGDPLSTYTRCEATWIDGREYFSLEHDKMLRERDAKERQRIVQKILAEGGKKKDRRKDDEAETGSLRSAWTGEHESGEAGCGECDRSE